jgi:hypothetical protein
VSDIEDLAKLSTITRDAIVKEAERISAAIRDIAAPAFAQFGRTVAAMKLPDISGRDQS